MSLRTDISPKEKSLRGYLARNDFDKLQVAKEFLYAEYDIDRLDKELRIGINKPVLSDAGSFNPGKKAIDRIIT